jgi:hypothetical protein
MSYVLYYSNYCQNSKTVISKLNKEFESHRNIHWICVDSRITEGKNTYVILSNGNKIIIPDTITRVPAMLSLKDYTITYGTEIITILKNTIQMMDTPSTHKSMTEVIDSNRRSQFVRDAPRVEATPSQVSDPMAYSLGRTGLFSGNVMSDQYSVWETTPDQLLAQGEGGALQMHNYVPSQHMDNITQSPDLTPKAPRISDAITVESLQKQRTSDLTNMMPGHK